MTTSDPIHPYGSANDLPSFQDMERQIEAFKVLSALLPNFDDSELKSLEEKRNSIVRRVDAFYDLLGHRNWVFTGDLRLKEMDSVIASPDAEGAEERLIAYFQQALGISGGAGSPSLSLIEVTLTGVTTLSVPAMRVPLAAIDAWWVTDHAVEKQQPVAERGSETRGGGGVSVGVAFGF